MSLIYLESWDLITTSTISAKGWTPSGATGPQVVSGGRTDQCLQCASGFDNNATVQRQFTSHADATYTLGCAFYWHGNQGGGSIIGLGSGTSNLVTVGIDAFGVLSTNYGGYGGSLPQGTWNYVEVSATIGGSITVAVNANTVISTSNSLSNTNIFNSVWLGVNSSNNNCYVQFDDVYITNGAGSSHTGMLGDLAVQVCRPNGSGAHSELVNSSGNSTNNWQYVASTRSQTTTFVESPNAGDEDSYTVTPLPGAGTVFGVQSVLYADKNNAGTRGVAPIFNINGSDYVGSATNLSTNPLYYTQMWENNPATSVFWTITDVNNAQIGARVE